MVLLCRTCTESDCWNRNKVKSKEQFTNTRRLNIYELVIDEFDCIQSKGERILKSSMRFRVLREDISVCKMVIKLRLS